MDKTRRVQTRYIEEKRERESPGASSVGPTVVVCFASSSVEPTTLRRPTSSKKESLRHTTHRRGSSFSIFSLSLLLCTHVYFFLDQFRERHARLLLFFSFSSSCFMYSFLSLSPSNRRRPEGTRTRHTIPHMKFPVPSLIFDDCLGNHFACRRGPTA